MKALKILVIALAVYAGVVVLFESLLGYFQPQSDGTLVITTTGDDGEASDRVLSAIRVDDTLYVAVNHWPRNWYREALANPAVTVAIDGETGGYLAVPVDGAEYERVDSARSLGLGFRILTGFPPRHILRLDPN